MALRDWVRNDGVVDSYPPSQNTYRGDEEFIMLVRDIQYQQIQSGEYKSFPTLYDVALANKGRNYINVTDNSKLQQDLPDINSNRRY
jgi:hypothetical protein